MVGSEYTALDPHPVVAGVSCGPGTITTQRHKFTPLNTMKKYIKSPDQKENDKHQKSILKAQKFII